MTSKYLVKFYFTTLLIGTVISTVISLILEYENVTSYLFRGEIGEFLAGLIWFITFGLLIATISQVAFFVYLFVHPLGMGIFRSFWPYIQLLLIIYAIFDLFYFRFYEVGVDQGSVWGFMWIPIMMIVFGVLVARYKNQQVKEANVFIPSLFFMVFITAITMIPFIVVDDTSWIFRSVFAILVMNAYQLIKLPDYIEASQQEKEARGRITKSDINDKKRAELRKERDDKARQEKIAKQQKKKAKNDEKKAVKNRKRGSVKER
ncbi:KinB-signaling pathway activation protein [Salinicoccus kekensis]|uniref:KinB signaling pathway activation protein n=1 Tax=Salinicoccus kekensis TaxID=714307 RepID=A0A285UKJ8_9STAP|nr:KinB-signaling pathway activation protein [Salinicoccus kekensis]SOC42410.1 KinB signaling pathway activation protein [Salinicoccus kekensis]